MPGPKAFQGPNFLVTAFQTAVSFSASAYSLGALQISIPALKVNRVLSANAYSLGSPAFATPTLKRVYQFSAPVAYALGSPSFSAPSLFTWTRVIGSNYSLGSPSFANPALTFIWALSAPSSYWLGSPVFGTPVLRVIGNSVHAVAYSLGSPSFASPTLRITSKLSANTYWLGSPTFSVPPLTGTHRLFANAMALGGLSFGLPSVTQNYQFTAAPYSLGGLDISNTPPLLEITTLLKANAFWLGSPSFGYPRLQWQVVTQPWPPTYLTQVESATDMLVGFLNLVLRSVPDTTTDTAQTLLQLVDYLRGHAAAAIRGDPLAGGTLGVQLQNIMLQADLSGATYAGIENCRKYLMSFSTSDSVFAQAVMRSALVMTLSLESKIISRMTFASRAEAQAMTAAIQQAFDDAEVLTLDQVDALVYETMIAMAGAITNHLATSSLQLPRYLSYRTGLPMPSLYLANRIYADASRSDEIERENGVINPCFCPRELRVLSDAGYPNSFQI